MSDMPDAPPTRGMEAPPPRDRRAPDFLQEARATFVQRNAQYADAYRTLGPVLHAMFPDGLRVNSAEGWGRLALFIQSTGKLHRYAGNMDRAGGHPDSALDLITYAAMLRELTQS